VRQRHGRRCRGGRCECSWEAFVYSRLDGKKIRKTFMTQASAREWRSETTVAVRRMLVRAPTSVTVARAGEGWLKLAREGVVRTRSGDVYKPATLRAYEASLRLRVIPVLGSKRLSEVSRNDVQDLVDALVSEGQKEATVGVTVSSLRVIYKRALSRGEVAVNPITGVQVPAVRGGRNRIAAPEECRLLLDALPQRDRGLWATAMYAGLRRGELMALRITDIDLEREIITVSRGWDTLIGEITTKSGRVRVVPVSAALRHELERHLGAIGWTDGLAFGIGPWRPFNSTPLAKRAERGWNAVGLQRITLHECRHTFASLMIAAGVNAKALSAYMGHANISITMDRYGHLMPGNEREAAGMLDAYLLRDAPVSRQNGNGRIPGGPAPNAPKSPAEGLARLLAGRRQALGLSQQELAARARTSPSLISRIESGEEVPSVGLLDLLAKGLGASLVLGFDGPERAADAAPLASV
jgi:integrase/DNA-binding XRE family transcriptional regulator